MTTKKKGRVARSARTARATPSARDLRQRVVWRLFDARTKCVATELEAVTARSLQTREARERAYEAFTRLAWRLARAIHPDGRRDRLRRRVSDSTKRGEA